MPPGAPLAPASRRVELHTGLHAHFLEWGAEDADRDHSVFLVHGFLELAWSWAPVVDAGLADGLHVVACDVRGHGDSDRVGPGGYYHFMDYVADLASLIDLVGRRRVSLVGHSMGGSVVSYYAGAYPERVHRLVLMEGVGPPEDETPAPDRVRSWIDSWRARRSSPGRGYRSLEDAAARLRAHDPLLAADTALELARRGTRAGADGTLRFKHDPVHVTRGPYPFRLDAAESFWRRVTCPVLLVEGESSTFRHAPDDARRRVSAFANARTAIIPRAGHMMQRHEPAALARALGDFLRG